MASTFKQPKPAKKRNKIYFDEEQQKPLQVPNTSKEVTIKINNKKHLHKTSDSADPTAAEMAVPRSRSTFDSKTMLIQPYGPLTRPRKALPKHEGVDGEGLWELSRSQRLRCHLKRGRRCQRVGQANAPLTQESQPPKKINLGMGWPHGQYMALTGTSMLAGYIPAEPALTGNSGPIGQNVGRRKVCMAVDVLSGSSELPS